MKPETMGEVKRVRKPMRVFSAKEKTQAVLALWSGRRSASGLMKTLGVPWGVLNGWEKRALAGMLTALDPKWKQPVDEQKLLPPRVETLMQRAFKPLAQGAVDKPN